MRQDATAISVYKADMGTAYVGRGAELQLRQHVACSSTLHCSRWGSAGETACHTEGLCQCAANGDTQQGVHLPADMQAAMQMEGLQQMACGVMGPCCAVLGGRQLTSWDVCLHQRERPYQHHFSKHFLQHIEPQQTPCRLGCTTSRSSCLSNMMSSAWTASFREAY